MRQNVSGLHECGEFQCRVLSTILGDSPVMTYGNATRLCLRLGLVLLTCASGGGMGTAIALPAPSMSGGGTRPPAAPRQNLFAQTSPAASEQTTPAAPATPALEPKQSSLPPAVAVSQDPRPSFDADTFINTMRAAWNYKRIAEAGGWPVLPAGTVLKSGDNGPLVALLRQRLAIEGDLPPQSVTGVTFDSELAGAVKRYQARHGLSESGAVRAKTLEALNVSAETRHRQLTASAQRLAGSTFAFGERYVVVNIPSATVEAVEGGKVARRYVAVVGKADRASPTVETRITAVNINPTWTVPISLIKKDIIPQVRKDADYLAKMKIRMLDGKGQEVDPHTIDWSTERAVNYTLRQDPGALNSLGQIRIDMPNKHAVYMHDTPKKRLFAQEVRFHSSGCVRVADVNDFVAWLLRSTPGPHGTWTKADIETSIGTATRQDVRLDKPIPVAWVYLTGYATPDGTVHFRNDVYGLDTPKADPVTEPQVLDVPMTSSITSKRS